jgi:triphosphoribosyl-dephospho-CoA synthase
MQLAAARDLVARQYCESFRHVFQTADWLGQLCRSGLPLIDAIVRTHVRLMAEIPDTLIARKCGLAVARQSAQRAADVLRYEPDDPQYVRALSDLDFWLRSDGHRRNPGTTADILGGAIFVGLCENQLPLTPAVR